ncbi:MAG: tryptophan synthase subunit alpha, partial [Syntrophomonadaceae bacterium]
MSRIAETFARARGESRAVFVAYLTAGDPSPDATVGLARALARAGADVLELGVPFSDPIADGPVLQRAAARALEGGTTLETVFAIARRIRRETDLALVLFSYVNPVLRRGVGRAAAEARDAGFDGVLLTDLPPEEAAPFRPTLRHAGLDTIFLVSPTSPPSRMAAAARSSSGFLYVVSRAGTTGARARPSRDLEATARRARRHAGGLPTAIGFGIGDAASAARAASLADGVVVGSALVRAAEEAVEKLARTLAAACR